ncbi:3230_t:CDS:10 [Acaulospora colombiana]|uniref:3230_t:CDS:1 n=1 Tax=Acaulospora colombiana TaxID=27376 RepID=A0ACA9K761_9GLOM|nr:3230_t:CDS:10 [Acaulospora colombiana]
MNDSFGSGGEQFDSEGVMGAAFIPAPNDVRSALQYTALTSLTPASAVMSDIPSIAITFEEYSTCNTSDPEYARIANLLENQASSQFVDIALQQQLHTVRNLLNQVDQSVHKDSGDLHSINDQKYKDKLSPVDHKEYRSNVSDKSPCKISESTSNIYPPPPKVIIESVPPKECTNPESSQKYPDSSSQVLENRLPLPKVVIDNEAFSCQKNIEDRNITNITKRHNMRITSPEVVIEIPPRDILAEYRSPDELRSVSRYGRLEEIEVDDLGRVLKILERSVREVETSDILPSNLSASLCTQKNTLVSLENDRSENDEMDQDAESNIRIVEDKLEKIINGIEAAIAAFTIMTGGKLSKQLYPEDLITSSLNLVKGQLGGIVYRIFELNTSDDALSIQSCTTGMSQENFKSVDERRDAEVTEKGTRDDNGELRKCGHVWKAGMDAASTNAGYIGYINDKKADTYTKSMAIDYLGTIAGRIKKFVNSSIISHEESSDDIWEDKDERRWMHKIKYIPKGEITTLTRMQEIKNLYECQRAVLSFLEISAMEDPAVQCARQFYLTEWGFSFINTLQLIEEKKSDSKCEDEEEKNKYEFMKKLMDKIIAEYWRMSSEDHIAQSLGQRSQSVDRSDILLITELLASRQSLYQNFDTILSRILVSLDMGVVAFRTKALRALGQVVVCDPSILSQVNVRQTIAQRLSDNSPAVRDAAIDLVGRYLAQKPEITEQYYKVISDRDTGLNVRKRVIKLLRDIYLKSTDQTMMIDIGCKILTRINDDDDHVKDLALKTVQELWLVPFKHQKNAGIYFGDEERQGDFSMMSAVGKKEVLARSLLVVGVAERLGERNGNIMGSFFKKVLEKDDKQKREALNICQHMVDCLFEHLLTLQDSNSKTEVVSCISTIGLLSNASPSLVSNHVVTLQPYLKSASSILQEVVPCLCVIIDKLTLNYPRLTKLLRSCTEKLKVEKKQLEAGKELSSARNVMVLLLIIGLLCKNFDFDKKRADQPEKMKDLDSIDKGPIITVTFQLVLYFCNDGLSETVQKMALQSFIYLSYPIIMLRPESTNLMDRILNTGVMDMKIQLMKVFLDFLVEEQQKINADLEDKKKKKNIPVDLKVLIGNADEFAEAGVSSSLMQRYLDRILECTFDQTQSLKIVALDVLGNIIQQGLAHPVLCMPTLVAMETSPEKNIRDKAFKLHQHLNDKHASLIHTRNVDCVKKAYAFQKQLADGKTVSGYAMYTQEGQPEALLNPMYSLLKDKRKSRNDFLISIVKTFDFDLKRCEESKVDVGFCRFIAENLAMIDYKTIEEVLHVVHFIDRVLSVVAISVLHSIQKNTQFSNIVFDNSGEVILDNVRVYIENKIPDDYLEPNAFITNEIADVDDALDTLDLPNGGVQPMEITENREELSVQEIKNTDQENVLPLSYAATVSICMTILMYLKGHLKRLYSLSEAKCRNFNPVQSGSHKDKPAVRNQTAPSVISWEGLPFLEKPLLSENDVYKQCELFRRLMAEDGTQEEEFAETELESDLFYKQPNEYNNMDFEITASYALDETSMRQVGTNSSSRKGIVRKLGGPSKSKVASKSSVVRKRNSSPSKKSKKKRKSIMDMVSEEEDGDLIT